MTPAPAASRAQETTSSSSETHLPPELVDHAADALMELFQKEGGKAPSMTFLLEAVINRFMQRERELYLASVEDSANGFYSRNLQLAIGKLHLVVPRVRSSGSSNFRPILLPPPYQRVGHDYEEVLAALLANGYSQSGIEQALKTLDLPYSREKVEQLTDEIYQRLQDFRHLPLKPEMLAVFLDAYHASMRLEEKRVKEISIYTAVGIDLDGQKSILGYWVNETPENLGFWTEVMQDLIQRGLTRPLLFVSDDFSGLKAVVRKLFPLADHQICYVHLQRNLHSHLSKQLYATVKRSLYLARTSKDLEEGKTHFEEACAEVAKEKPDLAGRMRGREENYLAFLKYPQGARKHLYTTNSVESMNAGLEMMRSALGGYFPSRKALDVNYFIQVENRNHRWMKKPHDGLGLCAPELHQLYALRYELKQEAGE